MMLLSSIIKQFKHTLINQHSARLLPSHYKALESLGSCRTRQSPLMQAGCDECDHQLYIPHSCGHRNCPHCQSHESQQWLERQLEKRVAAEYFMITFTLPAQFRSLAWHHQREVYDLMIQCAWETLKTFCENDRALRGCAGAIAVLHTHARNLDFHPHIHFVIPAAAVDKQNRWRVKDCEGKRTYLFCHKALAKVFRAKLLGAFKDAGLTLPRQYPKAWVVNCKSVGTGAPALVYLGRYLYRGVIQEKDIIACQDGKVTYRWVDSDSGEFKYKTVEGAEFLWKLLCHVLPRRFRRARNFGFLHPNSKTLMKWVRWALPFNSKKFKAPERPPIKCPCCGASMVFVRFKIHPADYRRQLALV